MKKHISITSVAGAAFLIGGVYMAVKEYYFVTHATKTSGKVVAVEHSDADGGDTLHPVFVFTDAAGVEHRCWSSYGSTTFFFTPGEPVTVLYAAAVPTHAEIDSFESKWLMPCAFTVAGVCCISSHYRWLRKMKLEKDSHAA